LPSSYSYMICLPHNRYFNRWTLVNLTKQTICFYFKVRLVFLSPRLKPSVTIANRQWCSEHTNSLTHCNNKPRRRLSFTEGFNHARTTWRRINVPQAKTTDCCLLPVSEGGLASLLERGIKELAPSISHTQLRNLIGPLLQPHLRASYCFRRVHREAIIVKVQFRTLIQ
jgi:hypothetical protein